MTWFGKTFRSISVSGSSAIRFLGDSNKNPEAKHFHEMIRDLDKKNHNPDLEPCIDYFIEHFGSLEFPELESLRLNRETTFLLLHYIPIFSENLSKIKKNQGENRNQLDNIINHGFVFIEKAIFIYIPDQKNLSIIYNFIFSIMETNHTSVLSRAIAFVSKCLSIPILSSSFYSQGDALANLWMTCYVNNPVTCQFYGPLFSATAQGTPFNIKNPDIYKPFFLQVNESFRDLKFQLAATKPNETTQVEENKIADNIGNLQTAINFIAVVCSKLNSGNFFSEFFLVTKLYFLNLPSLNVFHTFLACKTNSPTAPWDCINEICKSEFCSITLLESALEVLHEFRESPLLPNFSFHPFIEKAKQLSFDSQVLLFDIIDKLSLSTKLDFYNFSLPTWDTGISSQLLCEKLVQKNPWGASSCEMLSTFVLKSEYEIFRDNLIKDKYISLILTTLIDIISNDEEISIVLYNVFIKLSNENIKAAIHCINKIANNQNVIIYLQPFLSALRDTLVCDSVFDIYSKLARKSFFFVLSFLENDGVPCLFSNLKSDASLNFLSALASNGPYDQIDNYITENFEKTELANLTSSKLKKLMMAVNQESNFQGLFRIPSLSKFIKSEDIILSTQFDRFTFGINASKYGVNTKDNLMKSSPTYMNSKNVEDLCNDPEMLLHITSPNYPHFSVFQCHHDAPHCTATFKLEVTTTFWIYILSIFDRTVIMSTSFGEICLFKKPSSQFKKTNINDVHLEDGFIEISFFGLDPIPMELKKWNMITLTATDFTFQTQQIVVYFNSNKIGEIDGTVGSTVTFGSENMNKAIYYLSSSFQTSETVVTPNEVNQMYSNGPQVFCPTFIKMKPGFIYVPYKGIAKYFDRLGGPEFIFILMRHVDNYDDLIKLIQSAFNLLHLGLIKKHFFFCALRYILNYKFDLINQNKEKHWHPNFELLLYEMLDFDIDRKYEYSMRIFSDYTLLSLNDESFTFQLLPSIFENSQSTLLTSLFHFLIDTYIVFDLPKLMVDNIIKSINIYLNSNYHVLDMLLLVISAAAFVESNEGTMLSLNDDKIYDKQVALFQIIVDHMDKLTQQIKFEHLLIYISTLRDELALELLQLIAKICIITPTYFDLEVFRKYTQYMILVSNYETFWKALLIFYTSQSADSIEDFADISIARPELTDMVLELLSYYIRYEISNQVENPISFSVVKVVIKLMIQADIAFADYIDQIQKLACLGFDQEKPTASQFTFDLTNDLIQPKMPTSNLLLPPKLIQKLQPTKPFFKSTEFTTLTRIQALDPMLFDETCTYLSKFNTSITNMLNNILTALYSEKEVTDMNWKNLEFQRLPVPNNIEHYCKSEAVQIIANLIATLFIQRANSSGISNKLLVKLLINGCDANPTVVQIMHRKIVYSIFASPKPLTDDNYELFVKFVISRIYEGWWYNDDFFLLFQTSFIRKTKSTRQLILACIIQNTNVESQIRIMKELCISNVFFDYLTETTFFNCFVQLIGRYEIVTNNTFPEFKKELIETLKPYITTRLSKKNNETESNDQENLENPISKLYDALINSKHDYLIDWVNQYNLDNSSFTKSINEMKKEISSNSKIIKDLRSEITIPPTYHSLIKQQAIRIANALYIRRAFRYQFFTRFNKSNIEVETSISMIFQKEIRLKCNKNPCEKTMIVPAPHPFVVPQKFDPLCYDFPMPQGKINKKSLNEKCEAHLHLTQNDLSHCSNGVIFPQSMHNHKYPTVLPELTDLKNQNAPKCYEGWKLPSFVFDSIPLDSLLLNFLEATSPLFDCSILMNPELLPGVAAFNNESFSIVLNARLRNYNFFLTNSKSSANDDNGFGFSLYTSNIFSMDSNNASPNSSFEKLIESNQTAIPLSNIINCNSYTGQLILRKSSEMLSHFAIIENAAHGIYGSSKMFMHHPVISFKYKDVLIAIPRRFVYQNQMIDIYFINGLHLTLIMKESDRKLLLQNIKQAQQTVTLSQIYFRSLSSSNQLLCSTGPYFAISLLAKSLDKVKKMWQMSELPTLDYLLYLNVIGGRSFNDLSQYPVFPWVLGDFNEDTPVLKRNLSKPMGTQTTARESRFISTYNETEPHCHYRTHYSHPAAVLHYMLRCEPFTFFNLHLHSGLDHRDRQFSSINDAWHSASEANLSDLKELIPEFYTLPSMFENPNHVDFQCRSDGLSLGTVVLPPWAEKNAVKFIWEMRTALECPETSSKIGNWIDLIFGFKQRGQAAIDAVNVFQPLAYDTAIATIINESSNNSLSKQDLPDPNIDITMNYALSNTNANNNFIETTSKDDNNVDSGSYIIDVNAYKEYLLSIEQRKALNDAILQFGECPSQLFTTPHPECEDRLQFFSRMTISNSKTIVTKLCSFLPNCTSIQFTREKDELVPHLLPNFEHYIGNSLPKLVKAWDGYIEFDANHPVQIDSIDSCSTTCVSPDRLILAIASRLGIIMVLSCVNTNISATNKVQLNKLNTIICSSYDVTAMAVSSQHALLVAASQKHIQLFDYTTGFLIKKIDTTINQNTSQKMDTSSDDDELFGNAIENTVNEDFEKITRIIFDDVSNFIVTISQHYLTIYGLDLRLIARTGYCNVIASFSCIAASDIPFWSEMPLYVTGHVDGSVYAWRANILQNEIYPIQVISKKQTNKVEITAIALFMNDRAVLAVDAQGNSFLATIFPFNQSLHATIAQMQQPLVNSTNSSAVSFNTFPNSGSSVSPSAPILLHHPSSAVDQDEESADQSTKAAQPTSSSPTSIMGNNSPFSQLSSSSTSSYFMSPQVFETCRICGSSIKGGIGVKCMCCCLYVCKQCVASKRPMICSFCKNQFHNPQSFNNEQESDNPASSETEKAKTKVGSILANAFSFRRGSAQSNSEMSSLEKKSSTNKIDFTTFDSDVNNDELSDDSMSKSNLRNQAIRRNSLILSRVNHPVMVSSNEPADNLMILDLHSNSNSSSNETLEINNTLNGSPSEDKSGHSMKLLTHTQMNMNEQNETETPKLEKKSQKTKTKKSSNDDNSDRNDEDLGTMTLRYREEPKSPNGRRYSLSPRLSD